MPRSIQDIIRQDTVRLAESLRLNPDGARVEVQCLLQQALHASRAHLLAHPERTLDSIQQTNYDALLCRRLNGEPVAYILGEREFFGLLFKVTPDTLIPRPETELLIELALQRMPALERCRVLDLGAGSGAIAIAIAHARPNAEVLACDASTAALMVAQDNAQQLGIDNIAFLQSNWFGALGSQRFDLIVSNPPYIPADDPHLQQGDLRFEPVFALASGVDGLDDIRLIVSQAKAHLQPGGWLLLEHGYDQAARVRELMREMNFGDVFSACDLAGIERISGGRAA